MLWLYLPRDDLNLSRSSFKIERGVYPSPSLADKSPPYWRSLIHKEKERTYKTTTWNNIKTNSVLEIVYTCHSLWTTILNISVYIKSSTWAKHCTYLHQVDPHTKMAIEQTSVESTPSWLPVSHVHSHLLSSQQPVDKVKMTSGSSHVENIPSKSISNGERVTTDALAVL